MEQHSSLNPGLISEILMAKVSETTGQLVEPIKRYEYTGSLCYYLIILMIITS